MVGPSSQISKLLLSLLVLLLVFYVYMDYNLYIRIQNYPLKRTSNDNESSYSSETWFGCEYSPLCTITVKAVLLDQTNLYLFAPLVHFADHALGISDITWITPNKISIFHVFVAILSAKCVASNNLAYRRIGVVLFEFRTFLDDVDGHVARVRKHIKGELSEIGTAGYYVDGLCDALGCTAFMIGVFIFLKNNPPRRGYMQLPTTSDTKQSCNIVYKAKVTIKKVARKVCFFSTQMIISSTAWNRYIALYQDMMERTNVPIEESIKQDIVFRSSFFFTVSLIWRILNVHNLMHCLLLMIFCDKLWEFLRNIEYVGLGLLLSAICVTEIHIIDAKNFIYHKLTGEGAI